MKRPLFVMLTGLVLGEAFACLSGRTGVFAMALFVLAAVSVFIVSQNRQSSFHPVRIMLLLLTCFSFWGALCFYAETDFQISDNNVQETSKEDPDRVTVYGRVLSVRHKTDQESSVRILIDQIRLEKKLQPGCIMASLSSEAGAALWPGDQVEVTGVCHRLQGPTNPGEFDTRTWYLSQGVRYTLIAHNWRLKRRPPVSVRRAAWKLRERIRQFYQTALPKEDASLLEAMVLGEKTDLSEEQKRMYSENGAAHLLAVSGLHVSILGGSLFLLLRKRGFGYGFSCLAGGMVLLFYGSMTGSGSSVTRAVIMYLVYLAAQLTGSDYDIISAMSLSGILLLVEHPVRLMEGGFQISYVSVLAIGLILPWAKARTARGKETAVNRTAESSRAGRLHKLKEVLFAGTVISAVTAPVLMRIYYEWTPVGILLNLILLPCMEPLMVSAVSGGLLGNLAPKAGAAALMPARGILFLFEKMFTVSGMLPIRTLITGCPSLWQIVLIYLLEAAVFWICLHPDVVRTTVLLAVLGACCLAEHSGSISLLASAKDLWGTSLRFCPLKGDMAIDMLDVGQGECILIRTPDRKTILIDGGSTSRKSVGKYVILPALKYYGVKYLDYIVATHMDEDHISGLNELFLSGCCVRNVLLPDAGTKDPAWQTFYESATSAGARVAAVKRGDQLKLDHLKLLCLHPREDYEPEDRNDTSVVLYLSFHRFDMLFTGDLGEAGEKIMLSGMTGEDGRMVSGIRNRSLDVLKVAHHGSKYSTDESFLSHFPGLKAALISAGRNNRYGHPHPELLERLQERDVMIYDTPGQGAVSITTDGSSCFIRGFLKH